MPHNNNDDDGAGFQPKIFPREEKIAEKNII